MLSPGSTSELGLSEAAGSSVGSTAGIFPTALGRRGAGTTIDGAGVGVKFVDGDTTGVGVGVGVLLGVGVGVLLGVGVGVLVGVGVGVGLAVGLGVLAGIAAVKLPALATAGPLISRHIPAAALSPKSNRLRRFPP